MRRFVFDTHEFPKEYREGETKGLLLVDIGFGLELEHSFNSMD
jgi:hypothetical protein